MFSKVTSVFYDDKTIENAIIGRCSCSSLYDKFKECQQYSKGNPNDPCYEIEMIADKCYKTDDKNAFNRWILAQFEESYQMIQFLQSRQSNIPEKMHANSFGIFTNPVLMQRYLSYKLRIKQQTQIRKSLQSDINE